MAPLPQPLPDLAALDLLVTVAELGSISAAAATHRVTQPAASLRLRGLERVLGVRLLDRGTTGSRLTTEGEATVEWAATVLQGVHDLLTGTAALRSAGWSQLRLAASLTVAEYLVPAWLDRLAAEQPALGVSLEMGNTARVGELVVGGDVELGFVEGPQPRGPLRSRHVCRDELIVVVGSGHRWAGRRRPVTVHELAKTPMVLREPGSGTREVLARAMARHGAEPRPLMELGSTTALKAAAVSGAGPAVLSVLAVGTELRGGRLVAVPCADLDLAREIRAVWPSGRVLSPAAHRLLAIAQAVAKPGRGAGAGALG